ncbi:hypothetical protein TMatcc_001764 [Talaromyces marneffei ATCC 18224]
MAANVLHARRRSTMMQGPLLAPGSHSFGLRISVVGIVLLILLPSDREYQCPTASSTTSSITTRLQSTGLAYFYAHN